MFRGRVGFLIFHGKQNHQCGADGKQGPAIWDSSALVPATLGWKLSST